MTGKQLLLAAVTLCVAAARPAAADEAVTAATAKAARAPGVYEDLPAAVDAVVADIVKKTKGRTLAIAPFLPLGPNVRERKLGDIAAELLATRLVKTGQVTVVERGQLDRILEETKLSLLGLTDASNASKVGQMLGADLVVVGSVSETGELISVSVRAVDTGSGEAQAAWETRFPASTAELLSAKYVVQKSRADALFRSLLIPGWGQSYNGDDVKAGVFFGTGLALVGFTVVEFVRFNGAQQDYRDAKTTSEAVSRYDSMVELNREKNIVLMATGVFWAFNATEAFINGTSSSSVRVEAAAPSQGGTGIQLAYRY